MINVRDSHIRASHIHIEEGFIGRAKRYRERKCLYVGSGEGANTAHHVFISIILKKNKNLIIQLKNTKKNTLDNSGKTVA